MTGILCTITCSVIRCLNCIGAWVGTLPLRLVLAYEFGTAGLRKFNGDNWFANIQDNFPFPFNSVPVDISWFLATWSEILGGIGLLVGLATRFWAASLIILDIVAWVAVHGDHGYNVCDNGYKLPLLYLAMLIPVLLYGAGKLSLDHWVVWKYCKTNPSMNKQ